MPTPDHVSFATLTSALGKELGFDEAVASEDGFFRLEIDGLPVTIFRREGAISLYSAVGSLPLDAEEAAKIGAMLLHANALFRGTGEACLGVAAEDNTVTLCWQTRMQGLGEGDFVQSFENFLRLAVYWAERVKNPDDTPEEAAPDVPLTVGPMAFA